MEPVNNNPFEKMHFLITTSISHIFKLLLTNGFDINHNFKKKLLPTLFRLLKRTHVRTITRLVDKKITKQKMKSVTMEHAPIFIIGHWRSGTSMLHDYLCKDPAFSFANTFQVFFPRNFISYERVKDRIKEEFPETRPMDNVKMDFDYPFEDEFALQFLSEYSFYNGWFFPRHLKRYFTRYALFEGISKRVIKKWRQIYAYYIKKVYVSNGKKQLVLKNPVNTYRIKQLLEIFPDAKFIFIHRNPLEVYYSTIKVHKIMIEQLALQNFDTTLLNDYIIEFYRELINKYTEQVNAIPEHNFCAVKYETFINNPLRSLETIYNKLGLTSYEQAVSHFQTYYNELKDYKKSAYTIEKDVRELLVDKWKKGFELWENME